MVKNYLFDLYGTLVDLHTNEEKPTLWRALARMFSMYGANYTGPELKKEYKLQCKEYRDKYLPIMQAKYNAPDLEWNHVEMEFEEMFGNMFRKKGVEPTYEMIESTSVAFRAVSMQYIHMFDGVPEMLDRLHADGIKAYMLSNAQAIFTDLEVHSLGIHEKFDGIMYSSRAGIMKPSPYYFKKILDDFGLDASETVMVGNDYYSDILGAEKAGLRSIFVNTHCSIGADEKFPKTCTIVDDIRKVGVVKIK